MFDIVEIVSSRETIAAGYAGKTGTCYGFTTPSVTGVQVIGDEGDDRALNVGFDDGTFAWFHPSLVGFVDEMRVRSPSWATSGSFALQVATGPKTPSRAATSPARRIVDHSRVFSIGYPDLLGEDGAPARRLRPKPLVVRPSLRART
jgi:hypothetical protein